MTDVRSPGGWLNTENIRVARKVVLGIGASAVAALTIYGMFQGRQAAHYAEIDLDPVTKSGAQITSWEWPLTDTGFVIADHDSYVYTNSVPSPASKLIIGVGTQTSTGTSIASISVNAANTVYTLAGSGAVKLPGRVRVGPGQFVTFGWYVGSGQTVTGSPAGFARIKVEPCGTDTFDCD